MALAGELQVNTYMPRVYHVGWTATQNITTNTSTIHYSIYTVGYVPGEPPDGWVRLAEREAACTIAGQTVWQKTERVQRGEETIKTGTITVQHNSNGNASFTISLSVSVLGVLYSGQATFSLNRIFRGIVYIHDGTSFKEHACYIYNGSSWDMYQPYIYDGSQWVMY